MGAILLYVCLSNNKQTPQEIISPLAEAQETIPEVDPRISKVHNFFKKYNSPLLENAEDFIQAADEAEIDWKILPSIAMVESTGGHYPPSCSPKNPFGWTSLSSPCGFYRFESYREAIFHVSKKIGRGPAYHRFQDTRQISDLAKVYCERSDFWTEKMTHFMSELSYEEEQLENKM